MTNRPKLDLGFDPEQPATVTLPLGLLHGLAGAAWVEDGEFYRYGRSAGRERLRQILDTTTVDAGIRDRLVATIPPFESYVDRLRTSLHHAVDLYRHGDRAGVSHLGAGWSDPPPSVVPGWVWVNVLPGAARIVVYRRDLSWDRTPMPESRWTESEVECIVAIVGEVAPVEDTWNERTSHVGLKLALPDPAPRAEADR